MKADQLNKKELKKAIDEKFTCSNEHDGHTIQAGFLDALRIHPLTHRELIALNEIDRDNARKDKKSWSM
jgi:hypothetical protein